LHLTGVPTQTIFNTLNALQFITLAEI